MTSIYVLQVGNCETDSQLEDPDETASGKRHGEVNSMLLYQ